MGKPFSYESYQKREDTGYTYTLNEFMTASARLLSYVDSAVNLQEKLSHVTDLVNTVSSFKYLLIAYWDDEFNEAMTRLDALTYKSREKIIEEYELDIEEDSEKISALESEEYIRFTKYREQQRFGEIMKLMCRTKLLLGEGKRGIV
jgi:hypothetical protein